MKIKEFLGGIFFAAMLLCSGSASGQILTKITADNCEALGVDAAYEDCWLLDCSIIEADRLASVSLTDYDNIDLPDEELSESNYFEWGNTFYTHITGNFDINRVYPKLIISDVDLENDEGGVQCSWYDAVSKVKELEYKGATDWRLPTQRELIVMYIMNVSGFCSSDVYWSATAYNAYGLGDAFYVSFSGNLVDDINKANGSHSVRLVRELELD